jgi:hypothetical protein
MNSRNHFALGSCGQWYFEALAGINPDPRQPGFKRTILRPRPTGDLKWVKAAYPSMYGPIVSRWDIEADGTLVLEASIPANTSARVCLPKAAALAVSEGGKPVAQAPGVKSAGTEGDAALFEIGAGQYRFTVRGFAAPQP